MKRLVRAVLSCLPQIHRRPLQVESEPRVSWNGRPVAEVVQRSPSARMYDTLDITQSGNAEGNQPTIL
jgi:hypothetical protein